MRKDPLNPKYVRVELSIGLMLREVIRTGQVVEIGDILWIIDPDRITELAILGGTLENMVDRIIEETIEMKDIMTTIETENRSRERTFVKTTVITETEVQAIVD